MRREDLYLTDILEAADSIQKFLEGVSREEFLGDDLLRSAVLHKLTVIGEAAARLPKAFRDAHQQVEWRSIIAFRNIAVPCLLCCRLVHRVGPLPRAMHRI